MEQRRSKCTSASATRRCVPLCLWLSARSPRLRTELVRRGLEGTTHRQAAGHRQAQHHPRSLSLAVTTTLRTYLQHFAFTSVTAMQVSFDPPTHLLGGGGGFPFATPGLGAMGGGVPLEGVPFPLLAPPPPPPSLASLSAFFLARIAARPPSVAIPGITATGAAPESAMTLEGRSDGLGATAGLADTAGLGLGAPKPALAPVAADGAGFDAAAAAIAPPPPTLGGAGGCLLAAGGGAAGAGFGLA